MLKGKVYNQLKNTCQSPVCLIAGHVGPCNHKHCSDAYRKPHYWGISISEFYNRYDFKEFEVKRTYGPPLIIPCNPKDGNVQDFEAFRQSQTAITHLAGLWPSDKTVFREHVEFRWIEFPDYYPVTIDGTCDVVWNPRRDVQEYAYYIGPLNSVDFQEINVDAVYEIPDIYKNIIATVEAVENARKQWCACSTESDYCCNSNSHQLHNNPDIQKGGQNGN